ncbi:MAG: sensor histidine kinase, partial [Flammeovirgaceae bacterium]
VIVSLLGSAATTYFTCPSCDVDRFIRLNSFLTALWATIWVGNGELNRLLSKKISWVAYPLKRFVVGVIGTVVYTVGVTILISKCWEWIYNLRLDNYTDVVIPSLVITFFISLFMHSRSFLIQWRQSAVNTERLQKESAQAQYESLRNQVNPHFLFNSLNALTNLVYEDQDKAAKFIKQLSEVYRYVLETRDKELVPLQDEVKFLESYLYLQQIRFGNKLKLDVNLLNVSGQVAPLALQMLVENAIKHNVIAEDRPLTIRVVKNDGYLVVENTLQKKAVRTEGTSGVGLENIRKRYAFLTDKKVTVQSSDSGFKVELPIL